MPRLDSTAHRVETLARRLVSTNAVIAASAPRRSGLMWIAGRAIATRARQAASSCSLPKPYSAEALLTGLQRVLAE